MRLDALWHQEGCMEERLAGNNTEIVARAGHDRLPQRWRRYMRAGCGKDGSDMLKTSRND